MMEKFGVLSVKQITLEYKQFLMNNDESNVTDFAIMSGAEVNRNYRANYATSDTKDDNTPGFLVVTNDFDEKPVRYYLCYREGVFIPYLSTDFLPTNIETKKIDKRFSYVYFGAYPQTYAKEIKPYSSGYQRSLTVRYRLNGQVKDKDDSLKPFKGKNIPTIIDIKSNTFYAEISSYYDYRCFKVEPVKWIVDNQEGIMFPDKCLFSGISFAPTRSAYDYNRKTSEIYPFLEDYFIPDLLQFEKDYNKIIHSDIDSYLAKRSDKLLADTKKKCQKEIDSFYKNIEKEFLEKIFGDNIQELDKLSKSVYEGALKELEKVLNQYKEEQLKKYNAEIDKCATALENKLREFIAVSADKEKTFDYIKKQFDLIAKKEFEEKMLPIITKQTEELNKLRDDLVSQLSQLVAKYFMDFQSQVDDLVKRANTSIQLIEKKEKDIKNSMASFDQKLTKLKKEVDQEFSRITARQGQIESEIVSDVIRKVMEVNPVKEVNITIDDVKKKGVKGLFHKDFESILQLVSLKMPVFLVGPAGCGKNVILKQCAEVLGKKFFYQNDANEDHKLLGFVDANGIYHQTPFYKAFTEGGLLMLDEMDNANASVLLKLNSAIGSGNDFYMTFPNGETLQAHKDFQVVAAANTYGTGQNAVYCGRNQIDGATLDRYFTYTLDYDKTLEKSLVMNKDILGLFWEIRKIVQDNDIRHTVSTRAIVNMDKIISSKIIGKGSFTLGSAFDGTLIKGLDKEDLGIIVSRVQTNDEYTKAFLAHLKEKYSISQTTYNDKNVNQEDQDEPWNSYQRTRKKDSYGYEDYDGYGNYKGYSWG